jgi:demethylmenaquinone methyltransferase/2-methoxy-6-polyprenyl-1,4-benzoquinol methylase
MEVTPDLNRALAHYALIADRYDDETRKIVAIRHKAIDALQLAPGQRVLDAGCGTGACLPELAQRVGEQGVVVGIEPSAPLLDQARARAARFGNVRLVQTTAQDAKFNGVVDRPFDAVLFCYTHDLQQSEAALRNLLTHCRPGARVVATGTQYLPRWAWPIPQIQRFTHRHYITARDTMDRPYHVLERLLVQFEARRVFPWHSYLAVGLVP